MAVLCRVTDEISRALAEMMLVRASGKLPLHVVFCLDAASYVQSFDVEGSRIPWDIVAEARAAVRSAAEAAGALWTFTWFAERAVQGVIARAGALGVLEIYVDGEPEPSRRRISVNFEDQVARSLARNAPSLTVRRMPPAPPIRVEPVGE